MVHFNKPHLLDRLRDLVQKIDQCHWKQKGELSREISLAPKQDLKNDWSKKSSPNPRQNQAGQSNLHPNPNSNSNSKEKEKPKASTSQPKKTEISDKLSKDGKLTCWGTHKKVSRLVIFQISITEKNHRSMVL